jgi:CubicO group peptidase (beta-lactamase class C family)
LNGKADYKWAREVVEAESEAPTTVPPVSHRLCSRLTLAEEPLMVEADAPSEPPIHGTCDPRFARVREVFERNFREADEIGAAVSVTLDGESVIDLWGGHVDKARTQPWERDTLVNVYSTTKGMTALCAHRLVERGELDLDAPVAEYWPEFAAAGKDSLPVRYLLSHQAGLPAIEAPLPTEALFDWDTMASAVAAQKPWWKPGEKHGYHALTFGWLVGELVRRVSGRSLGTYFREEFAKPLDLDFHIGLDAEHDARTSPLFQAVEPPGDAPPAAGGDPAAPDPLADFMKQLRDPKTMTGAAFSNPQQKPGLVNTREWRGAEIPAANGHGTARALARVYGALARGGEVDGVRILEADSIRRATEEQASGPDAVLGGFPMRFGLGFMLRQRFMPMGRSDGAFGHPGNGGSIGFCDPELGVGFGYTMNQMTQGLAGGTGAWAMIQVLFEDL